MTINNKTDTISTPYNRAQYPVFEEGVRRYIQDELQRIENSLRSANEATIQVADKPGQPSARNGEVCDQPMEPSW